MQRPSEGWLAQQVVPCLLFQQSARATMTRNHLALSSSARGYRTRNSRISRCLGRSLAAPKSGMSPSEVRICRSRHSAGTTSSGLTFATLIFHEATCGQHSSTVVRFSEASLVQCDLRRSNFTDCDFSGANLRDAKLTRSQGKQLRLSTQQTQQIDWQDSDGEEPGGG